MATRAAPTPSTALVAPTLDHDELMALLGQSGMTPTGGGQFHRMSLISGSLVTDPGTSDEETWPPTRKGPTMVVRIVKPPVFYNAIWLGPEVNDDGTPNNGAVDPARINRTDLNKRFVKKYDDPAEQAADEYSYLEAYEAAMAVTGKRGSFKADLQVQIVPESGEMTGDETVYNLTLSTTSAMDWRGTSKNPGAGVVQEKNFIVQLAEFAIENAPEGSSKAELAQAVLNAMTALRLGGVVAEVYIITARSDDGSRNWPVIAFKPVHIETTVEQTALPAGDATADDLTVNSDDIPF